jgi:hypothetical protein
MLSSASNSERASGGDHCLTFGSGLRGVLFPIRLRRHAAGGSPNSLRKAVRSMRCYPPSESCAHPIASWYGPVHNAFLSLSVNDASLLEEDLLDLLSRVNTGGPKSLVVPGEYLEVVITRH